MHDERGVTYTGAMHACVPMRSVKMGRYLIHGVSGTIEYMGSMRV